MKSPGGDIKQFTNEASDTILKWLGTNKKKLLIVKEVNSTVTNAHESKLLVDEMAKKSVDKSSNADDDHMNATTTTTTNINEKCEKCDSKVAEISYLKRMKNLIADMMIKTTRN